MTFRPFTYLAVVMATLACGETSQQSPEPGTPSQSGTERMAQLLAEAYAAIDVSQANYLVNDQRTAYFRNLSQSQDLATRVRATSLYCYELLNSGATERAVVELESLIEQIVQYRPTPETMLKLRKLLATAYLRIGEQENCIGDRSHASCIVPIAGDGIYTMTKGSEKAIELALDILQDYPEDAETIWLLNVAHMTLGTYPDGVPAQWQVPESAFRSDYQLPRFRDVSRAAGLSGTGLAGGCAVDDFNNDGLLDIIASSWSIHDGLRYFVNLGNGRFEERTAGMQLDGITSGLNIEHADYDNDGDLDLFILRGAWLFDDGAIPNSLLRNNGDGSFTDVTIEAGLLSYAATQTAEWADFNLDGWLDLFVGTETSQRASFPCEFYLSNGDGTFTNAIAEIGVDVKGFVKGCAAGDVNNDGWPDLYISYYQQPNKLLLNNGTEAGSVTFREIGEAAGVGQPLISFPTWIWDFNNDGWDDIFVSGYGSGGLAPARDFVLNARGQQLGGQPRLYINQGDLTFRDMSQAYGLTANLYTMGCNFGDLDNDGYEDMYLGTGDPEYTSIVPNKMYRNNAGRGLQDVTSSGGFGHIQKGHAVGFGDFDNDGDQDIFQVLGGAYDGDVFENILFENPGVPEHNWVILRLVGTKSNRSAIGAKVRVTTDTGQTFYRTVTSGSSFGGSSLQVELGLGRAGSIRELHVTWPHRESTPQSFGEVPINTCILLTEGQGTFTQQALPTFDLGAG
ncbi:MAG: CRTAC1 family protein [Saprospiraceae bacterium]|nr:CRTAC1 family protein [Saprospiraceae bacterium]